MSTTYYSGPGKVYLNSVALQAQGENGQITATINVTPFDNWGLLSTLYPAYLGVSVGATPGVLAIGTRPHGAANAPTKIFAADGRLYFFVRTAITKHPDLKLGVGEPLFGACEITALGDPSLNPGTPGYLINANTITESGATDPGGPMGMSDFIRGAWTGAWGTLTGWGGDAGAPLQAEDAWTIQFQVKYSPLKVQRVTRHFKLDSVAIMAKCRLVGPTHTQMVTELASHTSGSLYGTGTNAADLILTGPGSKTITLKQAEVRGAGFEFGGTKLGTGEVGFVNLMKFTSGAPQPLLVFSA